VNSDSPITAAPAAQGRAICIIGMHRSGTSMIAGVLHGCGLYLGPENELLGANSGNADGHFEHKGFLHINDALLAHFGGSWDFPPALEAGWQEDASLAPLRAQAKELAAELSRYSPWGWKEPRTTVLLPFWKSLVPELRFVVCVRSPLEVARSLARRNKLPVEQGIHLWQRYTRAALEQSAGHPRLIEHYEDFILNPESAAERVARFCGLDKPRGAALSESGVRPELRHQTAALADVLASDAMPAEVKFLYLGLRGLSGPRSLENDRGEGVNELLSLLEEFRREDRLARLEGELAAAKEDAAKLRAQMLQDLKTNHRWAYRVYRNFVKPFRVR
jgi:hypothetical protein